MQIRFMKSSLCHYGGHARQSSTQHSLTVIAFCVRVFAVIYTSQELNMLAETSLAVPPLSPLRRPLRFKF